MVGVPVDLLVALAFGLVGALAMIAALAAAPGEAVNANTGTLLGLKGLVAALAVRFGPPLRAFAAGPRARRRRGGNRERPPGLVAARARVPGGAAARLRAAADLGMAVPRCPGGARVSTTAALGRTGAELRRAVAEARAGWSTPAWIAVAAAASGGAGPVPVAPRRAGRTRSRTRSTSRSLRPGSGWPWAPPGCLRSGRARSWRSARSPRRCWSRARAGRSSPRRSPAPLAAIVAGLLSGGVVRLRRAFVAVSTWLLAWLVWLFLLAFPSVSGGSQGLIVPERSLLGLVGHADGSLRGRARAAGDLGGRDRCRSARRAGAGALGA